MTGCVLMMPSRADFDAWAQMGNSSWDWKSMEPYFRKFQCLNFPSQTDIDEWGLSSSFPTVRNSSGPIQASWSKASENCHSKALLETFSTLGGDFEGDVLSGQASGAFANPGTIDPKTMQRSYSVSYYQQAQSRPNLEILTEAYVQRVLIEGTSETFVAVGVQYFHESKTKIVRARKEVILAAGTFQSPKLLELSGIGRSDVLQTSKIPVKIQNDHVGENLQDHLLVGVSYEVVDGFPTVDGLLRQEDEALQIAMDEYTEKQAGSLSQAGLGVVSFLPVPGQKDAGIEATVYDILQKYPPGVPDPPQHKFLRSVLENEVEASAMYSCYAGQGNWGCSNAKDLMKATLAGNYITLNLLLLHPFSTGCTHISSSDPARAPIIDPRYLSHPLDLEIFARHLRYLENYVRKLPQGWQHPSHQPPSYLPASS